MANINAYADDIVITTNTMSQMINVYHTLIDEMDKLKLKLNTSKSALMRIIKGRRKRFNSDIWE